MTDEDKAMIRQRVLGELVSEMEDAVTMDGHGTTDAQRIARAVEAESARACLPVIRSLMERPGDCAIVEPQATKPGTSRSLAPSEGITAGNEKALGRGALSAPAPGKTADGPSAAFTFCRAGHGIECVSGCAPGKTAGEAPTDLLAMAEAGIKLGGAGKTEPAMEFEVSVVPALGYEGEITRLRAELAEARREIELQKDNAFGYARALSLTEKRAEKAEAEAKLRFEEAGHFARLLAASVRRQDVVRDVVRWIREFTSGDGTLNTMRRGHTLAADLETGRWLRDLTMVAGTGETATKGGGDFAAAVAWSDHPGCLPGCQDVGDYHDPKKVSIVHANGCPIQSHELRTRAELAEASLEDAHATIDRLQAGKICCPFCGGETDHESGHQIVVFAYQANEPRCRLSARVAYCGAPARGEYGHGGIAGLFFVSGRRNEPDARPAGKGTP